MKAADVRVSTREFESSHGRLPRGKGTWAFLTDVQRGLDAPVFWSPSLTSFTEAKRLARKWAVEHGFNVLHVGS